MFHVGELQMKFTTFEPMLFSLILIRQGYEYNYCIFVAWTLIRKKIWLR